MHVVAALHDHDEPTRSEQDVEEHNNSGRGRKVTVENAATVQVDLSDAGPTVAPEQILDPSTTSQRSPLPNLFEITFRAREKVC